MDATTNSVNQLLRQRATERLRHFWETLEHDVPTAIRLAEHLLRETSAIPDAQDLVVYAYAALLGAHHRSGDLAEALRLGAAGLALIEPNVPTEGACSLYDELGYLYTALGQFDLALDYNQRGIDTAVAIGSRSDEAIGYNDRALIYSRRKEYQQALRSLERALQPELFAALQPHYRALIYNNLAANHLYLEDSETALAYVHRGLREQNGALLHITQGRILTARQEFAAAEEALMTAQRLAQLEGNRFNEAMAVLAYGRMLRQRGTLGEARQVLESAAGLLYIDRSLRAECLGELAAVCAEQYEFQPAYRFLLQQQAVSKQLFDEQSALRTQTLEVQQRTDEARADASMARATQQTLVSQNRSLAQLVAERDAALGHQEQLAAQIADLSTPVLPLIPGVLLAPIVGVLDRQRIVRLDAALLRTIAQMRADVVLLDITGVPLVDTEVAAAIVALARAIRLLGCQTVMVGVRPEIAQSIVGLGFQLNGLNTRATLAEGLVTALALVGKKITAL